MLEIRLLKYFLAIARELNITRAAESLFISQSTLSKQMMQLEEEIGSKLYIRGGKNLELTEEGEYLKTKAIEILSIVDSTEENLKSSKENISGDIWIGCGESIAMEEILKVFAALKEEYPNIKIHIHSGDSNSIESMLENGTIDMGLLIGPYKQSKYDYFDIKRQDRYGILIPQDSDLADHPTINIDQLKELPLIVSNQSYSGNQEFDTYGINYDLLDIVGTYNLINNATYMVEQNIGYALCLDRLVNTANRNLEFKAIDPEISVNLYLVSKKYKTHSPAMKVFNEYLRDYYFN